MFPEIFTVLSLVPRPLHYSVLISYCMQIQEGSLVHFITRDAMQYLLVFEQERAIEP